MGWRAGLCVLRVLDASYQFLYRFCLEPRIKKRRNGSDEPVSSVERSFEPDQSVNRITNAKFSWKWTWKLRRYDSIVVRPSRSENVTSCCTEPVASSSRLNSDVPISTRLPNRVCSKGGKQGREW